MATELTCGAGGSTGQEVIDRINALSQVPPRATLRSSKDFLVNLDDTGYTKLEVFDDAVTSRGGFNADNALHRLVNNSGQVFDSVIVSIGLNVRFSGTEIMDVLVYINDAPYSGTEFSLRGEGDNKPISIFWQSDVTINPDDHIEVWAKNGATGNLSATIERTQFRMEADVIQNIL